MILKFDHLGLLGRLGNSLFQFAATVGLASRYGYQPRFNENWIHRPYFSVPEEMFAAAPIDGADVLSLPELQHIDARTRPYMQDTSLFMDSISTIRAYLAPSSEAQALIAECDEFFSLRRPILSVHVRRGDNVPGRDPGVPDKENYFVLPSLGYYRNAIEEVRSEVNSVAVFSDDFRWCEENLGDLADYVHRGVPRPKEHEREFLTAPVLDQVDLHLQAQAERHVVTGSTFGIWGALLAGDENAIRCTPVYGRKLKYVDESLMFPSSWKVRDAVC